MVLRDPEGKIALELAKNIGRETNNVAEYFALLAALDYAATHNIAALRVRSDSELLVRQMQGRYKVKSADLKPLHERASKLSRQLQYFAIEHVRRELNRDADALANVALDSAGVPEIRRSEIARRGRNRASCRAPDACLNIDGRRGPHKSLAKHRGAFRPGRLRANRASGSAGRHGSHPRSPDTIETIGLV